MLQVERISARSAAGRVATFAALAGLLSGCMSFGGGDSADTGGAPASPSLTQKIVSGGQGPIQVDPQAFEKQPYCPPIELQSDTFLITKYERGKEHDARALLYQANLEDWARECRREGDQTRIKVGLAGRVTPGPAWPGGEIKLPVRVAIIPQGVSDAAPVVSQLLSVPVTAAAGAPAITWSLVEDSFVVPRDASLKIVFGFDEGAPQRTKRR